MQRNPSSAIVESLDQICPNTVGIDEIITKLLNRNIITQVDADIIKAMKTKKEKNYAMFEYIMKKEGAMAPLLEILRETNNNHIANHLEKKMNELKTEKKSEPAKAGGSKEESSAEVKLDFEGNNNVAAGGYVREDTYHITGPNASAFQAQPDEQNDKNAPKKVDIKSKGDGNKFAGRNITRNTYNINN